MNPGQGNQIGRPPPKKQVLFSFIIKFKWMQKSIFLK